MINVKFTRALKRFFPDLKDTPAKGNTIREVLAELELSYPGILTYVLDEQGKLRQHVNIFIDKSMIKDRTALSDSLSENSEIYIIQALSGG